MTQEEREFEQLKQDLIECTEAYLQTLKNLTFSQYTAPENYNQLLTLRQRVITTGMNLGVYRFKACAAKYFEDPIQKLIRS